MSEKAGSAELYRPRTGEAIDQYVAVLSGEPEHPLSDEQKIDFFKFREELLFGQVITADGTELKARLHNEPESLEDIVKNCSYSEQKHEISIDYFLTTEGRQTLADEGLLAAFGLDEVSSALQVRSAFQKHALSVKHDTLESIADKSKKNADAKLASDIAGGIEPTVPDRLVVFDDATNLTRRIEGLSAYRRFFRKVSAQLQADQSGDYDPLIAAKRSIVAIYQKQVNGELAESYPDVFTLLEQTSQLNDQDSERFIAAFNHLLPNVIQKGKDFSTQRRGRFMVRLDRVRNGASMGQDGKYTAISPELEEYLATTEDHEQEHTEAVFSKEDLSILDTIRYDATQMQALTKEVMAQLGLLSAYSSDDYSRDRPHRQPDGKWMVVIRSDATAMTADDPQGGFEIPSDFNRTLTKSTAPVGVIPGLAHELQHVIQQNNIRDSPGTVGVGKTMFGRRNDAFFEAGAIRVEKEVQHVLFGRNRDDSPHYLRALTVIEDGGNEADAAKVFYESYSEANPSESPLSAAKVAVSRVMRLARRYGGYNSQPLNYSESGLLLNKTKNLPGHVQSILFDYGALEIEDLARLHEFDLLPDTIKPFPMQDFVAIVTPVLRKHIEEAKRNSTT